MDDRQFEGMLKEQLQRMVDAQGKRLEGLEDKVRWRLEASGERASVRRLSLLPRVKLSLAFGGALATFLVGILIGGYWGLPFVDRSYQGVTFIVALPEANKVEVVGDFNGWKPTDLHRDSNGVWSLRLDLAPGRYEYAFIVDGLAWKPDPRADEYVKSYDSTNSVKYVGDKGETS